MLNQTLSQSQKVQAFRLATKIVLDVAEMVKSKSDMEQKEIVNKTIALLRELFPDKVATSWYARTYTGSKNQNDSYKIDKKLEELSPFKYESV